MFYNFNSKNLKIISLTAGASHNEDTPGTSHYVLTSTSHVVDTPGTTHDAATSGTSHDVYKTQLALTLSLSLSFNCQFHCLLSVYFIHRSRTWTSDHQ